MQVQNTLLFCDLYTVFIIRLWCTIICLEEILIKRWSICHCPSRDEIGRYLKKNQTIKLKLSEILWHELFKMIIPFTVWNKDVLLFVGHNLKTVWDLNFTVTSPVFRIYLPKDCIQNKVLRWDDAASQPPPHIFIRGHTLKTVWMLSFPPFYSICNVYRLQQMTCSLSSMLTIKHLSTNMGKTTLS